MTTAVAGAGLAYKLPATPVSPLHTPSLAPEVIPEIPGAKIYDFPIRKTTPSLWQRTGSLLGRVGGVISEYAGPATLAAFVLDIALGPGDTPRPAITDVPLPNEPPTLPAAAEKLRQEYLAEMDRLRRNLFNGELDEGEASFIRARIGVLMMLVGALPHTPENPFPNTRPSIVNSADGVPNSPDGADAQGNVAGPEGAIDPWDRKWWGSKLESHRDRLRHQLKNPDIVEQWYVWRRLLQLNPRVALAITEVDLGPPRAFVVDRSGRRHVQADSAELKLAKNIMDYLDPFYGPGAWKDAAVDLRTVHPSHSLPEFFPHTATSGVDDFINRPKHRTYYIGRLKVLLTDMGTDDPQQVLRAFVKENARHYFNQDICILQLPSGKQIIWDGHHRIAALVQVVREKDLDPDLWLSKVPVEIFLIRPNLIPEPLILRCVPAHELTIDDLLPPP